MTIGELAKAVGLRPSAIRYYESAGLLPEPVRVGGRRRYDRRALERLALLEFGKSCGFRLAEVRTIVRGFDDSVPLARRLQTIAKQKLVDLDREATAIAQRRARIERALACRCGDIAECSRRILRAFEVRHNG